MTLTEALEIFEIWKKWYWPCDFIIGTFFIWKKPKSLLPYPPDKLEEALNIVAEYFFNNGDKKLSNLIQESISSIWTYEKDEEAVESIFKAMSNPEMKEVMLVYISKYKERYQDWLNTQINKK